MTDLVAQLTQMIEPVLAASGYELVRVSLTGAAGETKRGAVLQIMAERPDGVCTLEDCEQISRAVSDLLDAEDVLPFAYRLEASSPGIDRPLTRPKDYVTWSGHVARVALNAPIAGRKRFTGVIAGLQADELTLETDTGAVRLPLAAIAAAKLELTDKLIQATAPLRAAQGVN